MSLYPYRRSIVTTLYTHAVHALRHDVINLIFASRSYLYEEASAKILSRIPPVLRVKPRFIQACLTMSIAHSPDRTSNTITVCTTDISKGYLSLRLACASHIVLGCLQELSLHDSGFKNARNYRYDRDAKGISMFIEVIPISTSSKARVATGATSESGGAS
jgi:hypothetical protein